MAWWGHTVYLHFIIFVTIIDMGKLYYQLNPYILSQNLQLPSILNEWGNIQDFIHNCLSSNPYAKENTNDIRSLMWAEQCTINVPVLIMASIYLYLFAKQHNCNKLLFATRDCCHWYLIFKKLFPSCSIYYFDCSRVMFENATKYDNLDYNNYVKSIVGNDITRTIYIDVHGTGRRAFSYFEKDFNSVPYVFLLSTGIENYSKLPDNDNYLNKFTCLVFNANGSGCESLNYDIVGTLQHYNKNGPVRDKLEYHKEFIIPYHECIKNILTNLNPMQKILDNLINNDNDAINDIMKQLIVTIDYVFSLISHETPVVLQLFDHCSNHQKDNKTFINNLNNIIVSKIDYKMMNLSFEINVNRGNHQVDFNKIQFNKIISDTTVHGLIYSGIFENHRCVIKIMPLSTGIYYDTKKSMYVNGMSPVPIDQNEIQQYVNRIKFPFDHCNPQVFKQIRRKMFFKEIHGLKQLYEYGLTPEYYGYCIKIIDNFHFGLILMERKQCSVKDILLKRELKISEMNIIENIISKLHNECHFVHNDLKPSNICVSLNEMNEIEKCVFIDVGKLENLEEIHDDEEVKSMIQHDLNNYKSHTIKNENERANIKN